MVSITDLVKVDDLIVPRVTGGRTNRRAVQFEGMPSPQRVSWAKTRVTVVSLVAALILLTLVYLLSGQTILHERVELYVFVPDATGIAVDSPVEVDGIDAGAVKSVALTGLSQPDRMVKLTLNVLRDRLNSITSDSYVQISAESLVGDKLIAITSGTSPTTVRPGAELSYRPQTDLMKRLDLTQFEDQLRSVNAMLDDIEGGKSALSQFVLGDQMYRDVRKRVGEIEKAFRAAAHTTSDIGSALYTDRLYRDIRQPINRLDDALARIQSGQTETGHFLRDPAQFESLVGEIGDLRKSIADLRGNDLVKSDEAYAAWNRSLASLIRSVDDVNRDPLFNTSDVYDSLTGAADELRQSVHDFQQSPKKYLWLKVF
jgi:phospholipid/cholesterol/gamma-HCH transport system substrate-binding protein